MIGGSNVVLAVVLAFLALSTYAQPAPSSEVGEAGDRLREFVLLRRLINNMNQEPVDQALPAIRLGHELGLLARALEADLDFDDLRVSRRAVRSFCGSNSSSRQCRSFCFNLGDPACADGDLGGNGEDAHFLASGNHPGK